MIVFLTFSACIVAVIVILYLVSACSKMISDILRIKLAKSKLKEYNKNNKRNSKNKLS